MLAYLEIACTSSTPQFLTFQILLKHRCSCANIYGDADGANGTDLLTVSARAPRQIQCPICLYNPGWHREDINESHNSILKLDVK